MRIAAEQLVAAVAAEGDLGLLADEPRDEVGGNHRGVGHRLVVLHGQLRQKRDGRRRGGHFEVIGAEMPGHDPRMLRLVVAAVAGEGDGERLHTAAAARGHGRHQGGVEPAAEEDAHRDVSGEHLPLDGVLAQPLELALERIGIAGAAFDVRRERPVGPALPRPAAQIDEHGVSLRQFLDAGQHAEIARHVSVGKVMLEGMRLDAALAVGVGHQRFQLRGESQTHRSGPDVQRLLAGAVARQEHRRVAQVVEGHGEHAVQPGEHVVSPLPVRGEDHFGIAAGAEGVSQRFELRAEVEEVVDLAVEGDAELARGIEHRLMSGRREVDDRQAAVSKPDATVGGPPESRVIRTAMGHGVAHRLQRQRLGDRRSGEDSDDSAHDAAPQLRSRTCRGPNPFWSSS